MLLHLLPGDADRSMLCVQTSFSHLWTSVWLDGSLPVVDSLLDSLNQQLTDLTDLKPALRQVRLTVYLSVYLLSACLTACLSAVPAGCPPSGRGPSVCEEDDEDRDEEQRAAGERSSAND